MVDRDADEPQLEMDQIQGDILVGLQKDAELFVGFVILDVGRFKRFLSGLRITSGLDALRAQASIEAMRANGGHGRLDIRGRNIGFTHDGLRKLGAPGLDAADPAFREGLAHRAAGLNDPPSGPGAVANWLVGNGVGPLDGMVLLTGRDRPTVNAMLHDLDLAAGDNCWRPFFTGCGSTRAPERGHEHFGFLDGVSQPAVRGRIDGLFAGRRFLDPGLNPANPNQGLPGADLHWPGEFVFGYPKQDATDVEKKGAVAEGGAAWMRNGSLMVYRRLEQLVPEFAATLVAKAAPLGESPVMLGARMVGRFRSGAPISRTPLADDPAMGGDDRRNNDFEFGGSDAEGRRCPFAAHIRKSYPRNDFTPAAPADEALSEADTQTHRIMRRGIPFGPEVDAGERAEGRTHASRGLMFVCYQTDLARQFEFIMRNWVNNPSFARPGTGEDPILGQAAGADRTRHFAGGKLSHPTGDPGPSVTLEKDFIRATGGGYFFMPSLHAIQHVLAA